MEDKEQVEKPIKRGSRTGTRRKHYTYEEKLRAVKLRLEEGFGFDLVCAETGVSTTSLGVWLKQYKERCWPNAINTRKFDLEKVIVAGDDAFVTYNGWTNDGRLFRNTERFKLRDGKIIENECFFGTGVSFPNNQGKK